MKRFLSTLVLAVALLIALPAQAQFQLGLKGGMGVSKVSFSNEALKDDNRTGFFIGPMAEFTIPLAGLGIDVAALYTQSKIPVVENKTETETLKTVEVPLNLKWTLGFGKTFGIFLAAGPQFGFNVGNMHNEELDETFDMKKCYTTFNVGGGLKLFRHIQLGVNYNFGISKMAETIANETELEYDSPGNMKKNTWQVSLAYMF